jgi:hypothetical protein
MASVGQVMSSSRRQRALSTRYTSPLRCQYLLVNTEESRSKAQHQWQSAEELVHSGYVSKLHSTHPTAWSTALPSQSLQTLHIHSLVALLQPPPATTAVLLAAAADAHAARAVHKTHSG